MTRSLEVSSQGRQGVIVHTLLHYAIDLHGLEARFFSGRDPVEDPLNRKLAAVHPAEDLGV